MLTAFRVILLIFFGFTFIMIFADVDAKVKKMYIFLWSLIATLFITSTVVM